MSYVIPSWELTSLPVVDNEDRFPVRRIYCIGRNYAEHAKEMGMDERDPPFFFMKPTDAIVQNGAKIPYPPQTKNYHYEGELVVAIGGSASSISVADANNCIYGYGVGLDMTRRDVQIAAREMGRPWDMGKGFDNSAPCSEILPVTKIGHPEEGRIHLAVNGETKQDADIKDMIWNVPESISYLSGLVTLEAGDLIMTGTPAGVGPVISGDTMVVSVEGVTELTCTIA
ncbi:MAG: fumarylacetoacetate hydrolase family protein [Pseudomonadota bacterium]|nr:fumarylacetoacetate hydrolase family protein [Pseudomonadota bacterium]